MNAGRVFVGSVLVAIGVVFVLEASDVLDAGETLGSWWPASIIGLGLFNALDRRRVTSGSAVLVLVGAVLLAITTDVFGADTWSLAWPIALIGAGVWLVLGWGRRSVRRVPNIDTVDGLAVLSASRVGTRSEQFRHASLTAVLGGVTLDLSEATPAATGAVVDATAVLGSITVLVPRGWLVEVRGIPVLGGWDDTTDRSSVGSGAPRLEVRALVALGGLEVKHAGRWST
ncbi:MAG: DUF5668 domain-containing protein [Acidimicrobiia bacterium]